MNNIHKNKLQNIEHNIDKLDCSGMCKLNCECGSKYIGKTKKKKFIKEHKYSFIHNKPEKSIFINHLLEKHHPLNPKLFNIIKIVNNKN